MAVMDVRSWRCQNRADEADSLWIQVLIVFGYTKNRKPARNGCRFAVFFL